MRTALADYQRNAAFVAFILLVCVASFIYLVETFVDVLVPLVWSLFFAVPLTALISLVDEHVTHWSSKLVWTIYGDHKKAALDVVAFTAQEGESHITLEMGPPTLLLLEKLDHPCETRCPCGAWCCFGFACCGVRKTVAQCCQCRVRLTKLAYEDGELVAGDEVNRFVQGWCYYATPFDLERKPLATGPMPHGCVQLQLCLDQAGLYPAVLGGPCSSGASCRLLVGTVELDRTSLFSWVFAVFVSFGVMLLGIYVFVLCISLGVDALKSNANAYMEGVQNFIISFSEALTGVLPDDTVKSMKDQAIEFAKTALPNLATAVATHFEYIGWQTMMFLLYLVFWIFEPLPVNDSVARVIKSYLLLKTVICFIFAGLMSSLLFYLDCPLWNIFFVVTFLLNFIPEVGFIIAGMLMIPAILFDGHLTVGARERRTLILIVVGGLIKVVTANIIEVRMYATRGGQYMRMHPVVLVALMMFFESMLGVTGMFLAIPIMAAVKYYMVSADMPPVFLNPMLLFIEGDEAGPHKNFVDRQRYGTTLDTTNTCEK